MTGETVDESKEPISRKTYWGKRSIFNAYNSYYLSKQIPKSQDLKFEAFDLSFKDKINYIYLYFKKVIHRLSTIAKGLAKNQKKH